MRNLSLGRRHLVKASRCPQTQSGEAPSGERLLGRLKAGIGVIAGKTV